MSVRVKICGITNVEDALAAVEAGADALGFIFYPKSPRYISPEAAAAITSKLPGDLVKVGVFVNESMAEIRRVLKEAGMNRIQLHGEESPEFCAALASPVIKALRVKDRQSLAALGDYRVSAFLLDSYVPGQLGGTGARFNWDLAMEARNQGYPIFLAGGLDPENVADAVFKVRPFGVDVSSGVESAPGRKDHEKVREFIRRAKSS